MDKQFNHQEKETEIYKKWEAKNSFTANKGGGPFTILMPPPNANASLHAGHAMYAVEDVLTRWKRMQGYDAKWIPGMDHAGFETQYVYEKHLAKAGKSRMDFDRKTLYENIFKFVDDNSGLIYEQFKRLGFSADWQRSVFTLDKNVTKTVFNTFSKMHSDGLIYRDNYLVNYCIHCGTSLAELEVKHVERIDPLYYVKYKIKDSDKFVEVATVRPETIFVDTHLAVNPKDKKNKNLIGVVVLNPITNVEMEIIGEDFVDPDFGTGIVKLTPAHDHNDFQAAKKNNLPIIQAIDLNGRITEVGGKYSGMKVKVAREAVVKDLAENRLIEKIDNDYTHSIITCYKCGRDLEPLTVPNWFIKVADLKKKVVDVVTKNKVSFHPKKYKKHMLSWLEIMHDWPISRQIVWGIRIPVWYEIDPNQSNISVVWIDKSNKIQQGTVRQFLEKGIKIEEIESGLQSVYALTGPSSPKYVISDKKPTEGDWLPETDTFDTWFSSGQWPIVTLKESEFDSRFPTDVMGTLSEILKFWVSRMIMFSLYLKNEVPFKDVYLWSMVTDNKGAKMSKSKGNVVNPIELVDKYGADALRMSLLYGVAPGARIPLSENKVKGMRNFANKVWNMGRFIELMTDSYESESGNKVVPYVDSNLSLSKSDTEIVDKLKSTIEIVDKSLEKYKFSDASEAIYHFMWNEIADKFIEDVKDRPIDQKGAGLSVLTYVYKNSLKLLHPFMPFVTEAVWGNIKTNLDSDLIITSEWPKTT